MNILMFTMIKMKAFVIWRMGNEDNQSLVYGIFAV